MDLKTSYNGTPLNPIYAGSGAIATISKDGDILACPMLDEINVIQLLPTRKILHTIENDDEQEITALKLTADGRYLCFVSQAQLLKIFDLSTGKILKSMKISSPAYILDTDSTSTLVAVGGTDGSVTVVDIENGYITHSLKGHGGTISSLKFYGERNNSKWLLASGDTNGTVKVWDLVKRKCLHTTQEHTTAVRGMDFRSTDDEDTLQMITGGRDDIINYWELNMKKKCKLLKTIAVHQQVESCGFVNSPERNLIYTAGGDAVFQIVSLQNEGIIKKTRKPIEELFIVGVLPILNDQQLYLVLSDQTLLLLDMQRALSSGEEIMKIESRIAGNHGTVADIRAVGPDLDKLALATNSPALRMISMPRDSNDTLCIDAEIYEGHADLLNSLDATEDGLWLATGSKDNSAILWHYEVATCKFIAYAKFEGHASSVTAVGLPNVVTKGWPEFIITASNDLTIKKWIVPKPTGGKTASLQTVNVSDYTFRAHEKDINALAISPNDSLFATASYDKTCKIWNLDSGELKATLANHKRGLWDVTFCQYDKFLATCSGDKTIKIWNLDTFAVVKSLEGHTNAVQRCSFMNKQRQLVSSGADGLVKIWDCSTGDCLKTLDGHGNRIWALTVLEDGDLIVTADADGVFQFWRDSTEEQKELDVEKEKLKVEQEQSLQNYLADGDWTNAFLLAITLDHPMRLFSVLKKSISIRDSETDSTVVFNKELDHTISTLNSDQLLLLMKRCRDWNTNARTHSVAQKTIKCILLQHNIADLSEIPGLVRIVESIIPYTKRHVSRIDNLVEQSYILDYSLVEMENLF
ncbi:hypothetical protein HG535_0F04810 [Zygotorulaspora mrakii]|uniref:U3 small nucleolar RNA-associated protein 13 C-terminal domain-containing protein n=1 Tax=Zygotorulaspora mrakii TaxID=42260 RepID=A0A7H9B7K6_ZYGMR|nr:uncharacterized protein HG535_0F04810 [Zygotorulaspora mrakii]QLG73969.1 hypothetical protein HG535_0F04810 [Zygotorulaspora mrakii]